MIRIFVLIILSVTCLLSACGENTAPPMPTVDSVMDIPTSTPFPSPTRTENPAATLTASITPLPTIPTFTPTFDARTIVTVTPASPAECPKEDPTLVPDFPVPDMKKCFGGQSDFCYTIGTQDKILEFLQKGGSVSSVIKRLDQANAGIDKNYHYKDVTGDTIPELMFRDFRSFPGFNILSCQDKKWSLFQLDTEPPARFETIEDMNKNGVPEIILTGGFCSGSGCFVVYVYEWNKSDFINLSPLVGTSGLEDFRIQDVDDNGTKEIILTGDRPGPCCAGEMTPWRYATTIYEWDGQYFSPKLREFAQAVYRFQTIQDADREVVNGRLDTALLLYQDAIFNNKLEWWSPERREYETVPYYFTTPKAPEPTPIVDTTEYSKLTAYSYYRIMLLHTMRGYESDAGTVYNTLQQKFGADPNGRLYAEMATAFWGAYQSTHKMYDGCAAAIHYADEHPEILIPLGSDYHGSQSHTYVPADVCPFR